MKLPSHNPDVLSCIANLSNDEVFTPPGLANSMLDLVEAQWARDNRGEVIWENPDVTFIDPCCKSGVFLREVADRLIRGLESQIPDLQERVDHVLTKQVFGIAITNLTALLSRRSLYCSKAANGQFSVGTQFENDQGNIWFRHTEHNWVGGKPEYRVDPETLNDVKVWANRHCFFCGASEKDYGRGGDLESHAYAFIHAEDVPRLVNDIFGEAMQFDVVIGNPPYQLSDGGAGKSARPLYQLFVESAKKLDPRYISLVIPSRWMAGGKGLVDFRRDTLKDRRFRKLVDYIDSDEAFPGVDIAGGVSYFLWDRDNPGLCNVETHIRNRIEVTESRELDEYDIFVRYADALSILKKVWPDGVDSQQSLQSRMSGRNAFGFGSTARGKDDKYGVEDPILLVSSKGESYVSRSEVRSNTEWVDLWKATVSRASPAGGRPDRSGKFYGLSSIRVIGPGAVTTEAYPVVSAYKSQQEAERMCAYLRTKFVRLLLTLRSANQSVGRQTFGFVPNLPMDREWTDELLREKYGLTEREVHFIDSIVRPMEGA